MQSHITFSIVTVCLNAADTIMMTMRSVMEQTYRNYEYIIWDGQSKDGTLELVRQYEKNELIRIFSEPDTGLYNAMNKAIDHCQGDYILFLNSGDTLADVMVLEDVAKVISSDQVKAELYFGDVLRKTSQGNILETYRGRNIVFRLLLAGRMPCHQSMLTGIDLMRKYRFDESYFITADYNFLMKCKRYGHTIRHIDRTVSCFDCTQGISAQQSNLEEMRRQDDRSMKELYPGLYYLMKPVKKVVRWLKNKGLDK